MPKKKCDKPQILILNLKRVSIKRRLRGTKKLVREREEMKTPVKNGDYCVLRGKHVFAFFISNYETFKWTEQVWWFAKMASKGRGTTRKCGLVGGSGLLGAGFEITFSSFTQCDCHLTSCCLLSRCSTLSSSITWAHMPLCFPS